MDKMPAWIDKLTIRMTGLSHKMMARLTFFWVIRFTLFGKMGPLNDLMDPLGGLIDPLGSPVDPVVGQMTLCAAILSLWLSGQSNRLIERSD